MPYVIRLFDMAGFTFNGQEPDLSAPTYLTAFDPDAHQGRGFACGGPLSEALRFPTHEAAWNEWRRQSTVRPLRPDGEPNRPLTAFTISVEEVP